MQPICIVTDTTAQFPKHKNGWQEFVKILPITFIKEHIVQCSPAPALPVNHAWETFGLSAEEQNKLRLFLAGLAYDYQHVFFLLPTKILFPSFAVVTQTLQQMNLPSVFTIIDSRTFGFGLGWLIQTCTAFITQTSLPTAIKQFLNHKIPHIYTLIYLPYLTSLSRSNLLDPDQAMIGDYLGIRSLVLLEHDQMIPYQKVRNFKNLVDHLLEYSHEFDQIEFIGLHFGISIGISERKNIQNRFQSMPSSSLLDSQVMSPYLNQVLGDQSICVILIESDPKK
jgi:fatty acid-binding protein DegV